MICLRCGYCCIKYNVVIVDDSKIGITGTEENLVCKESDQRCQHMEGNEPGKCSCRIHDEEWYQETPCFAHTQIEHGNTKCRIGEGVLNGKVPNPHRQFVV